MTDYDELFLCITFKIHESDVENNSETIAIVRFDFIFPNLY